MILKDYMVLVNSAHAVLTLLKRSGQLVPEPCAVCGAHKTDGHHEDYRRPHKVRWLCRKHHNAERTGRSHRYQHLGPDSYDPEVSSGPTT